MGDKNINVKTPETIDTGILETVEYVYPGRATEVEIIFPEFTSLCPWTGLPDFGNLIIKYIPGKSCVELKALKFYLNSFRNVGILQEHVVNRILDDLVDLMKPVSITVSAEFNPRGGLKTNVSASYSREQG